MNGVGGTIKKVHRTLGIATIEPDDDGKEVIFTPDVLRGGKDEFDKLTEGKRVRYQPYPQNVGGGARCRGCPACDLTHEAGSAIAPCVFPGSPCQKD